MSAAPLLKIRGRYFCDVATADTSAAADEIPPPPCNEALEG